MAEELDCNEIWGGHRTVETAVSTPGLDVHVLARPWGESSGGDVYYLSACDKGMVTRAVLADVSGHGETVSPLAAELEVLMSEHVNAVDQTEFVRALNARFVESTRTGGFATAVTFSYFAPDHRMLVVNAGHPDPLLFRRETESWSLLRDDCPQAVTGQADLPLGIAATTTYCQFPVQLETGDLVVLYTDSLTEPAPRGGGALGRSGVLAIATDLDPYDPMSFGGRLVRAVEARCGPAGDDTTVIVATPNGAHFG